ncbi:hypothetical protein KI387_029717, partial [Taxus chinensis]
IKETNYNIILGRPWIHRMKAIPSMIFQEVRFVHLGKVFVAQDDPNPFNIHLSILKKKPRVHNEFELPANQLNMPNSSKGLIPTSKLVSMTKLEPPK